jgi:CheY-like chemotaxis protein
VAEDKDLQFDIELAPDLPRGIYTDPKRLQQVLRNLLSNAFKFTEAGKVSLSVSLATRGWSADNVSLNRAGAVVAFSVGDTGIGIPADKLRLIFEPFQQAEMGTSRKYGGTGLGLSISREITRLLGGEIRVQSTPGEGSTFTLYLPQVHVASTARTAPAASERVASARRAELFDRPRPAGGSAHGTSPVPVHEGEASSAPLPEVAGDRDVRPGDRVLLFVEHDPKFADILLDMAHSKGFKGLITPVGASALALARKFQPAAITLDVRLPDMDGLVVLDRLKRDPATRHIPVHVISVNEEGQQGMKLGAFAWLQKPISKKTLEDAFNRIRSLAESKVKNLLVVEDNDIERQSIVSLLSHEGVEVRSVSTAEEALQAVRAGRVDCLVLDLRLPDMSGTELLERIEAEYGLEDLPVIVYTGKDLNEAETTRLKTLSKSIIPKDARSTERLRRETDAFLSQVEASAAGSPRPVAQRKQGRDGEPLLEGKKVLLVDDDVRNLFALTSILERWKVKVLRAESGPAALEVLDREPDVSLVLMDIMMPGMDGYQTTRAIRQRPEFASLPIVALTAKAMKGDRQKCLDAGASDYIAKPVDSDHLLSVLRVWVARQAEPTQEAS